MAPQSSAKGTAVAAISNRPRSVLGLRYRWSVGSQSRAVRGLQGTSTLFKWASFVRVPPVPAPLAISPVFFWQLGFSGIRRPQRPDEWPRADGGPAALT